MLQKHTQWDFFIKQAQILYWPCRVQAKRSCIDFYEKGLGASYWMRNMHAQLHDHFSSWTKLNDWLIWISLYVVAWVSYLFFPKILSVYIGLDRSENIEPPMQLFRVSVFIAKYTIWLDCCFFTHKNYIFVFYSVNPKLRVCILYCNEIDHRYSYSWLEGRLSRR